MTNFNNVLKCKQKIVDAIANSQKIMQLIFDDPQISMQSESVKNVLGTHLFDYGITGNCVNDGTCVFVETAFAENVSASIQTVGFNIQAVSKFGFMYPDKTRFPDSCANRNDRIILCIAELLGSEDFDEVGTFNISKIPSVKTYDGFSALQIKCDVSLFV